MFYLLENDGHNTPSWWRFRDQVQAECFLTIGETGLDGEMMVLGYFTDNNSWTDANGTLWEQFEKPELHIYDKTEEP
jgi:hypothetical protein